MRGNIIRSVAIVETARKTKNAAHPATEKKLRRLILQMPGSSSGALSCFGFLTPPAGGADFAGAGETGFAGVATVEAPAGGGGTAMGDGGAALGGGGSGVGAVGSTGLSITLKNTKC